MNISVRTAKRSVVNFLNRYHFVLFMVFAVGSLAFAIFKLNQVIIVSDQQNGYTSQVNNMTFDQQTIDRLRSLNATDESNQRLETSGRVNPFVE